MAELQSVEAALCKKGCRGFRAATLWQQQVAYDVGWEDLLGEEPLSIVIKNDLLGGGFHKAS